MINQRIINFKRKTESEFFIFSSIAEADFYLKAFGIWKIEDIELIEKPDSNERYGYAIKLTQNETKENFINTFNKIKSDCFEYTRHNNGAPTLSKDYLIRRYEDEKFRKIRNKVCEFADENE